LKAVATVAPRSSAGPASRQFTDAMTNEILFEAVDSRVATKNPTEVWNEWEDVDAALAY
jgi:hypothetical protein